MNAINIHIYGVNFHSLWTRRHISYIGVQRVFVKQVVRSGWISPSHAAK
jgi:hypothetical protein